MKKMPFYFCSFAWLLLLVQTALSEHRIGELLPLPYKKQEATQWCWAATTEMVMRYWHSLDSTYQVLSQCEQAQNNYYSCRWTNQRPEPLLPCSSDSLNLQNVPFARTMDDIIPVKYTCKTQYGALTWEQLTSQIDSGSPVITMWQFAAITKSAQKKHPDALNHFVVIDGYFISSITNQKFISYSDPWQASCADHKLISYEEYCNPEQRAFLDSNAYRFIHNVGSVVSIRPAP